MRCIYSVERGRWRDNHCGDIYGHKHSFGGDISVGALIFEARIRYTSLRARAMRQLDSENMV